MSMPPHISVLCSEVVDSFSHLGEDSVAVVDCTLGAGGHSLALLQAYPNIHIFAFDRDECAIDIAKARLESYKDRISFFHTAFSQAINSIPRHTEIGAVLADIGVSSMQLDEKSRGFSFESQSLDMRMDRRESLTAMEILNSYPQMRLNEIWREYGEMREGKKLTEMILQSRKLKPFNSCADFSELIARHFKRIKHNPATLAFQALRIEVNNELGELKSLLHSISTYEHFANTARIGIISFHSLEDRIIKEHFKDWSKSCICDTQSYKCECGNNHALGEIITKKPITPTKNEISQNVRSRSAKLRVFQINNMESSNE